MEQGFQRYMFRYYHDGAWWNFVIPAKSEEDARERLRLIPRAQYDGILEAIIPARPGIGWMLGIICWWKNLCAAFYRASDETD